MKLGDKLRDKVTGFEGIAMGRADYLIGTTSYGLEGPMLEGKVDDWQWFDVARLELMESDPLGLAVSKSES